jgi:putative DNA methylase
MTHPVKTPKKLIEVALPLDRINDACAHEKMPGIGPHPRGLHLWWARRPLAAARAVIFAQMVNDPSWKWEMEHPDEVPPNHLKASWAKSRKKLFGIIEELVKWENTANEEVLARASAEIHNSWQDVCALNSGHPQHATLFNKDDIPSLHDPFAGGGAIPIEAERLGLKPYASDLNPVAVLINKAMIEIPPLFSGSIPVNPSARKENLLIARRWLGSQGLAADIQYYGNWMRDEAKKLIGHHYPGVAITPELAKTRPDLQEYIGQRLKVITWIWARTVASPNPAFRDAHTPIIKSFKLASKNGRDFWIEPIVDVDAKTIRFSIKVGKFSQEYEGTIGRQAARCLFSNSPIDLDYISDEGKAGRLGQRLVAIVADGKNGRIYLPPNEEHERAAIVPTLDKIPSAEIEHWVSCTNCVVYGLTRFENLFTNRQILVLNTFSDLLKQAVKNIERDAVNAGFESGGRGLAGGGSQARAYAEAVAVYLSFAISRTADFGNSLCSWSPSNQKVMHLFGKQAIPMVWDFCEANVLEKVVGGFAPSAAYIASCVEKLPTNSGGQATQADAQSETISAGKIISTDPPYYDNVPYSNLSDFFYIWLRRNLIDIYPQLFKTIVVPRNEELVATATRHGGKEKAQKFFLDGMSVAIKNIASQAHPAIPVTIYYAFKQSETTAREGTSSPGWETFLDAVITSGLSITGTWPLRSEQQYRMMGMGMNALASSIVLVCRPRTANASTISRRVFIRELNQVLPEALDEMTAGAGDDRSPVAPVDLSQAIIGPGMAVFSKYAAVLEADGTPMSVRTALQLINRFLAEDDFDHDTQFCLHWFEQYGWKDGKFGEADTLARAKGTSVDGVKHAGVLSAAGGVVRLLKWADYPADWDAVTDVRLPVWEALHHLIRVFKTEGERGAGNVLAAVQAKAEATRQLAYRLYTLCERAGWAEDARAYNEIITSWSAIEAAGTRVPQPKQAALF